MPKTKVNPLLKDLDGEGPLAEIARLQQITEPLPRKRTRAVKEPAMSDEELRKAVAAIAPVPNETTSALLDALDAGEEVQLDAAQAPPQPPRDPGVNAQLDALDDGEVPPYSEWTVLELDDEIAARNRHRESDAQISATGLKKDKVAALEADDETQWPS